MPGILTRRIGPFPGWVWGLAAGGGFLLFMYMRGRGRTVGGQPGLPAVSPAASAVPFVPSVSVTGIPQSSQPAPSGPTAGGSDTPINLTDWTRQGSGFLYAPNGNSGAVFNRGGRGYFYLSDPGSAQAYQQGGGTVYFFPAPGVPVGTVYGAATAGTPAYGVGPAAAGGSGGFGYAGTGSLASPIGGWTVGWQPFGAGGGRGDGSDGSGAGSTVNRTGFRETRPRRRILGLGGGAYARQQAGFGPPYLGGSGGGAGGSQTINRRRTARPIRARDLRRG